MNIFKNAFIGFVLSISFFYPVSSKAGAADTTLLVLKLVPPVVQAWDAIQDHLRKEKDITESNRRKLEKDPAYAEYLISVCVDRLKKEKDMNDTNYTYRRSDPRWIAGIDKYKISLEYVASSNWLKLKFKDKVQQATCYLIPKGSTAEIEYSELSQD